MVPPSLRQLPVAGLAALALLLCMPGCKSEEQKQQEACGPSLEMPSAGFPSFSENPDDGSPALDFQACDSKPVDLNGDGLLDLAAANHKEAGFGFFMQRPDGTPAFAEGQKVNFSGVGSSNSAGIVYADFNLDGVVDIANSDHAGAVTISTNNTIPGASISEVSFLAEAELTIPLDIDHADWHGFAGIEGGLIAADFNLDGKPDIATANLAPTAGNASRYTSSFLLNTTSVGDIAPSFAAEQTVEVDAASISIDAADFNLDGKPDVAISVTADSKVDILTNMTDEGSDTIAFSRLTLEIPAEGNSAGAGPTNPVAADFNRDGKADVVTANWNVDTITVFTNASSEGGPTEFLAEAVVIDLCFNPLVLRHGDLDGDGDEDLVIVPLDISSSIAVGLLENTSEVGDLEPSFALVDVMYLPERMREVTFFDWLGGQGDGESPSTWFTSTGNVADFDNDGRLDIVAVVAHTGFAIEARSHLQQTDDILEYVQPGVALDIAKIFLPKHSELIQLVQD